MLIKLTLEGGAGRNAGFLSLISLLQYCGELGVMYVTVFVFSIDNFKRKPDQVQKLMDLLLEKIIWLLKEESIVHQNGVRVYSFGNSGLSSEHVSDAAEKVMKAIVDNNRGSVLSIRLVYTSSDEIVHMHKSNDVQPPKINSLIVPVPDVQEYCEDVLEGSQALKEKIDEDAIIKLVDVEKHMFMAVAPDTDIAIQSSGETRLSNFLLWQSSNRSLYSPAALWPEEKRKRQFEQS